MTNNQYLDEYGMPIPIRQSTRHRNYVKPHVDIWTRLKNPIGTIFLPEILKAISEQPLKEDKIKLARLWWMREPKNAELMRKFMEVLYHPLVKFNLPDTPPPYMKNDANDFGMTPNNLYKAIRKIPLFAENERKIANQVKLENTLIQQLETMYKDEAELYWMMICKKLDEEKYPTLNEDFFREAFPDVLPKKELLNGIKSQSSVNIETNTDVQDGYFDLDANPDDIINETVKRGRGRPTKPKPIDYNHIAPSTEKRPRGRPPKTN